MLCFSHIQHPIIIGKKKYRDIQFYTEVSSTELSYISTVYGILTSCKPWYVCQIHLSLSSNCVLCSAGWWNHNRLRKTSTHAWQRRSPSRTGNLFYFIVFSSRRRRRWTFDAKSWYTEVPFPHFWISIDCISFEVKAWARSSDSCFTDMDML